MTEATAWLTANWKEVLIGIIFVREFLNNLLVRVPSLKSNTCFEVVYNTLDALVATVKQKAAPPQPEPAKEEAQ